MKICQNLPSAPASLPVLPASTEQQRPTGRQQTAGKTDDVTRILLTMEVGKNQAFEALIPLVYREMRLIATRQMSIQKPGQTLQPTALVHEAWLKLMGAGAYNWESRRHFLNAAAEAMRHILADAARRKTAARNGGGLARVDVDGLELPVSQDPDHFIALHEAIDRLAIEHPLKAEIVKLKYFAGFENEEAADIIGIPLRTLERQWTYARAWLRVSIEDSRQT